MIFQVEMLPAAAAGESSRLVARAASALASAPAHARVEGNNIKVALGWPNERAWTGTRPG